MQDAEPSEDVTVIVDEDAVDERPAGSLVCRDVPRCACCCSALTSQDHGNDDNEALTQNTKTRKGPVSDASESDEEPSMRPADHVGHLRLSQRLPAEKEARLVQFLDFYPYRPSSSTRHTWQNTVKIR